MSLLARSQWRHLWRHPWLLLLSLIGVAVGVGGVVAMDLAISSCQRAFSLSQENLTGAATHWIVGGPAGVDETLYPRLRTELHLKSCAPVVEGHVALVNPRQALRMLGIDPIAEGPFRGSWLQQSQAGRTAGQQSLTAALAAPGAVAMTRAEAGRLGIRLNSEIPLLSGSKIRLRAILEGLKPDLEQALQGQILCDLSVAQEVLGRTGRLSRIELILEPGQVDSVRAWLPREVQLLPAATRTRTSQQMSSAFFLNLKALSMLSLLVGGLLIYNVIHFLSLQRRPWIAQLRILGATQQEIRGQILAEAGWIGAWGSLLGLIVGVALSRLILPLLTRTINDLYYTLQVSQTYLSPGSLLKGCLLGWGCSLMAAWWPALGSGRVAPAQALQRSTLEQKSLGWTRFIGMAGATMLIFCWLLLLWDERHLLSNLVAMVGLILGSASLTPITVLWFQTSLRVRLRGPRWLTFKILLGGVERSLSRLGMALIAMTVALSAVVSITLMVHSFRLSLMDWLSVTLSSDLYISLADRQAAKAGQELDPKLLERLRQLPEVLQSRRVKMTPVVFTTEADSVARWTQLVARDLDSDEMQNLRFVLGPVTQRLKRGEMLATEPFLRQNQVQVGQNLSLQTRQGLKHFRIAAGIQDYASDAGYLLMDLTDYQSLFEDKGVSGVALMVKDGESEALRTKILSWPGSENLEVRSQKALRQLSVQIFEQTFQVTGLLQVLAVLVAAMGTVGAVAANQLERKREFALWECLGLTAWERRGILWGEASLCGLWAGLAAWPCGLLQAYAMVTYINRRAFGWSLDFHVDPKILLATPFLGLLSATLATWIVMPRRATPAEDLRLE